MIRQIIYKEILGNLLSLRFILSLLLIISLFGIAGFVFVGKYKQQSQDYWKKTNKNLAALSEESGQLYELAFYEQNIYSKPKPLIFCAEGYEKSLPNCFRFNVFTADLPEVKGRSNFTLPHFSNIDWVFIISLVLSFVALVFTYDIICGEKAAGTLRQMLAGSIARHKILLGKYFSTMFTLGISLLLGLSVSLIIVISSKDVAINAGEWLQILIIIFLSFLYLSIFVLLGIFISSRVAYSANSVVILLLVWVGSVILIPSLGRIISDVTCKRPTQVELEERLEEADEQIWSNTERFGKNAGSFSSELSSPINNPPARARLQNASTNAKNQVLGEHHNKMLNQAFAGRNFTCVSPAVIYQRASEVIAGTGISHCVNLYQQIRRYQADLKEYVRSKDAEDPDSLHLLNPGYETAQYWKAISHKPVDFDTVPKFQEQDISLLESLQLAIWDIGLLVLFNLVFFAAAFVSFLKYDVR
ncbi:MAG: ABC transporter permease subunit [Planctomycetota bacterium]|jgi:ABC-type transport system involved in multi-copper enzyme maturation permease subunit